MRSSPGLHWAECPQSARSPHLQHGPTSIWQTSGCLSHLESMRTRGGNKTVIILLSDAGNESKGDHALTVSVTCKVQLRKVCAELKGGGP